MPRILKSRKRKAEETRLTRIGTMLIPLPFVAGVYGMNFLWMPELSSSGATPRS